MTHITGIVHLSMNCFCTPPKVLVTNETQQSDYCDKCGAMILSGTYEPGPRLRVVEDEE